MSNTNFIRAVHLLTGSYDPEDPTTKPRGAQTLYYLEGGAQKAVWLDPSTMIDGLCERKMAQEEGLIDQLKAYWQHRKEVRADQERVRKHFKTLIKELERESLACKNQVSEVRSRIAHHIGVLNGELKLAKSHERQSFLKRLRARFKPLSLEAEQILKDSQKFEKDAATREKLFKAAMQSCEFDQSAIDRCVQHLPILRKEILSTRLHHLNTLIDNLVDDAIIQGEIFKKAEEYEPQVRKLIAVVETTLQHYANYLTSAEPKLLRSLHAELEKHITGFEKLKHAGAATESKVCTPEMEEELQMRLYQLTSRVDEIQDLLVRKELNISELAKLERRDRLEALEEIRNRAASGIYLAMSTSQDLSELSSQAISGGEDVPSSGSQAIDAQCDAEQLKMLQDYTEIQKHLRLAIEYGGKMGDIMRNALAKLPPQATAREKSLLKMTVKELVTQAQIEQAKTARFSSDSSLSAKATLRLNKARIRKLVDVWQRYGDSEELQAKQSLFFDRLLDRGVKYKNVWVESKREIGMVEAGQFSDFKQCVLAKEGYEIPGFDLEHESLEPSNGARERVQDLLGMYPRLFDDCVEYVSTRVNIEEIPRGLQNEYVGLLVSYLLEQHTALK